MDRSISYIRETLHVDAYASVYEQADKLPLYLRSGYHFFTLIIHGVKCLLARPKETVNLTALRKQNSQLKKLTGFDCVLCLDNVRMYTKEKMLSEGIPFVIVGQQLYLPFLGIALAKNGMRDITNIAQISFITQRLLLTALYDSWTRLTLTEAANNLEVSKMSISRCFDELQSLNLPLIETERKMRRFVWQESRRALWEKVLPFLRNPVVCQYRLGRAIEISPAKLGGISAICHYTMLSDDPHTTFAITRDTAKALDTSRLQLIPDSESPDMVVHVMRYILDYHDAVAIDPLTAILSLTEEDKNDPRIESAIEEILEDCLHD